MSHFSNILRPANGKSSEASSRLFSGMVLGVFVLAFSVVWLKSIRVLVLPGDSGWPEAFLVIALVLTTLFSAARQLPAQNVLLAAFIIAAISGTTHAIGALCGIPFGPYSYSEAAGPQILNFLPGQVPLPWCVPLIWVGLVLTARGVGRLILRPWRKSRLYGFRLIGVTAALVVMFDFGLEPYASRVNLFWIWQPTKFHFLWYGASPGNFLGWLVTVLVILAFVTPVLINKSHQKFPTDYQPLIVWVLLNVLMASALATHQLWPAVAVVSVAGLAAAVMAVRGARW